MLAYLNAADTAAVAAKMLPVGWAPLVAFSALHALAPSDKRSEECTYAARHDIDAIKWMGAPLSSSQELAFPRVKRPADRDRVTATGNLSTVYLVTGRGTPTEYSGLIDSAPADVPVEVLEASVIQACVWAQRALGQDPVEAERVLAAAGVSSISAGGRSVQLDMFKARDPWSGLHQLAQQKLRGFRGIVGLGVC